jgi:hypothetical protein
LRNGWSSAFSNGLKQIEKSCQGASDSGDGCQRRHVHESILHLKALCVKTLANGIGTGYKEHMTREEQRKRPSHHIVHDFANLLSSGEMVVSGGHKGQGLMPPINTHVGQAFYLNCRKMYDFFIKPPSTNPKFDDLRAIEFTKTPVAYAFNVWNKDIQTHMDKQLTHVARDRTTRTGVWEGHIENPLFLEEFKEAWKLFLDNLRDELKAEYKEEIHEKINSSDFLGLKLYAG